MLKLLKGEDSKGFKENIKQSCACECVHMCFSRGVIPLLAEGSMKATDSDTTDETLAAALEYAVSRNLCRPGDAVVALHRIGAASIIKIMEVRDIYG